MSLYTECYKKMLDGYNKIRKCIDSVEYRDQLECVANMADNWGNLMDYYCESVYKDKSNRHRKRDAIKLEDTCLKIVDNIKAIFQEKANEFAPDEYEGTFRPTRVKNLREMTFNEDDYINENNTEEIYED